MLEWLQFTLQLVCQGELRSLSEEAIGHRKIAAETGSGSARCISTQTLIRLKSQSIIRNGSDEPHSSDDGQLLLLVLL